MEQGIGMVIALLTGAGLMWAILWANGLKIIKDDKPAPKRRVASYCQGCGNFTFTVNGRCVGCDEEKERKEAA